METAEQTLGTLLRTFGDDVLPDGVVREAFDVEGTRDLKLVVQVLWDLVPKVRLPLWRVLTVLLFLFFCVCCCRFSVCACFCVLNT